MKLARRFRRLPPWFGLTLLLVVALSAGSLFAPQGSAIWERAANGVFEETEGDGWTPPALSLSFTPNEVVAENGWGRYDEERTPEQPNRLSSLTIVDVSATPLSRRVAHELASAARNVADLQRIEVRIVGDELDDDVLGDQILVLEAYRGKLGVAAKYGPFSRTNLVFGAALGHVPRFGWGRDDGMCQCSDSDWNVEAKIAYLGLPFGGPARLAEVTAEHIDLAGKLAMFREHQQPVPAFPKELLAHATDLGSAHEAAVALGIVEPPVYAGRRHVRKGEALWRYEGPDAVERLERALDELRALGWIDDDRVVSSGADDSPHHRGLRRGDEHVRFQYHENRTGRLQKRRSTSSWSAETGQETWTRHVEGPELDPVIWVYYRNEADPEELLALHARARGLGPTQLAAFEANLPRSRRAELGLPPIPPAD